MKTRRTLAISAFTILGLSAAVCSILGYSAGTAVVFAVMGTLSLILLANVLSQVRAEGATQRRNLASLRERIRDSNDEITAQMRSMSQQLEARSAKNKDLLRKQLLAQGEIQARQNETMVKQLETLRDELAASVQEDGALTRSTIDTFQESHAVSVRNLAAWLDALRDTVEATDDQVVNLSTRVDDVSESVSTITSSLLQIQSESAERSGAMADHLSAFESSQLSMSRGQEQHLQAVKTLIDQNLSETAAGTERLLASIEELRIGLADSHSNATSSVVAAREEIVNSVTRQQKNSDAIVVEGFNEIRQEIANTDSVTDERLSEFSKTLLASLIEEHTKTTGQLSEAIASTGTDVAHPSDSTGAVIRQEISNGFDAIRAQQSKQTNRLNIAMYSETQQVEALLQLLPTLKPRWLMPSLGRWAIDARAMLHIRQIIQDHQPRQILELGSGTSTIWLGYLAEQLGASVVSIEHDERFKQRTDYLLNKHQLTDVVSTVHAPLTPLRLNGIDYHWYDRQAFEGLQNIDLLLIDGPVGTTNRWARYPALPVLWSQMAEEAVVVLDDAARPEESESVESWVNEFDIKTVQHGVSGLAIMKRNGYDEL